MTADLTLTARGPAGPRRSPLAHRVDEFSALTGSVRLAEIPYLTMVNLRVEPGRGAGIEEVLGLSLPPANRVSGSSTTSVLWLGPDEWLVVAAPDTGAGLVESLTPVADSVVDVSANRTTIEVSGPSARALLEKACTLDLHPRTFSPGQCAQTTFARALMVLWQTDHEAYRLLIRPSFADYVAAWLLDAAAEFSV